LSPALRLGFGTDDVCGLADALDVDDFAAGFGDDSAVSSMIER
jgi:hypothetical protein